MKLRQTICMGLIATAVIANTGCFARWRRWRDNPPPPRVYPDPVLPGRPPNGKPEILLPAPNGNGAPALPPPTSSGYMPPGSFIDPPMPPSNRGAYIPPTRTETTEPPLVPSGSGVILLPPDLRDPPAEPPKVSESINGIPSPAFPVGIPAFVEVTNKVSAGQRPDLDGLDWLKANGYRAVVHLHKPGTLNSADRDLVERRGLKYIALEVDAAALKASLVDDFARIVSDSENQPVFVYDNNGALNGAMWYLKFRLHDKLSDDQARQKAATLGLKESGTDEATALWLAIQMILRDMK